MIREIQRLNDEAVVAAFQKVREGLWNIEDKRIALLGLAFKPGTDDMRIAPALELARRLRDRRGDRRGVRPAGGGERGSRPAGARGSPSAYEAAHGAHCAVLCTEWEEFQEPDFAKLGEVMATRVFVDGRNAIDADEVVGHGFHYYPAGRRLDPRSCSRPSVTGGAGFLDRTCATGFWPMVGASSRTTRPSPDVARTSTEGRSQPRLRVRGTRRHLRAPRSGSGRLGVALRLSCLASRLLRPPHRDAAGGCAGTMRAGARTRARRGFLLAST